MSRIETLRGFIQANPKDPFPRYGLAMEHKNQGQFAEADAIFTELIDSFPEYIPAYFHAGGVKVSLGRKEEAVSVFRAGIDAATRKGDFHAKGELEAALADLDGN